MTDKSEHPPLPEAFAALGVRPSILRGLAEARFETPSEIQSLLIPRALAGVDILGQARTGTGKTAAFGIPILQRATRGVATQAIILVPTRELAIQVEAEIKRLAQNTPIRTVAVYGGQKIAAQMKHIKHNPEVLIGTPGRVIDLLDRRLIHFDNIRFVVLDEVDRMLDIGFRDDIRNILSRVKGMKRKTQRADSVDWEETEESDAWGEQESGADYGSGAGDPHDEKGAREEDREAGGDDAPGGDDAAERARVKAAEAELLIDHTGDRAGDRPIDNAVADAGKEGPRGAGAQKVRNPVPGAHQTMFVSATIGDEIERLARRYMREPIEKLIAPGADERPTVEEVEQYYFSVQPWDKYRLLKKLLEQENPDLAIIFTRTKRGAEKLAKKLHADGIECREIHGNLAQNKRDRVMKNFRGGKFDVLVATDLASRGIDVADISHIINYDIPDDPEVYIHRVGRTARMGARGKAFTLVSRDQGDELTKVENLINMIITPATIEGFTASPTPADWTEEKPTFGAEPGKAPVSRFQQAYGSTGAPGSNSTAAPSDQPGIPPVTLPPRTLGSKIPITRRHKRRR